LSNYFEECVRSFLKNPKLGIVYTDLAFFGARAKLIHDNFHPPFKGGQKGNHYITNFPNFNSNDLALQVINQNNFIHGSSMYTRSAYNAACGYKKNTGLPEDHDLFKSILSMGFECAKANHTFLEYRQHSREQANIKLGLESKLLYYLRLNSALKSENENLSRELNELRKATSTPISSLLNLIKKIDKVYKMNGFIGIYSVILKKIRNLFFVY
jgi:hypothetical protein